MRNLVAYIDFSNRMKASVDLYNKGKMIIDDKAKYTDLDTRDDIKAELKISTILTLNINGYQPVPSD